MNTDEKIITAREEALENNKKKPIKEMSHGKDSKIPTPIPYYPSEETSIKVAVEGMWQELRDIKLLLIKNIGGNKK